MENKAIDQAVDFFMNLIDSPKFEELYLHFAEDYDNGELREFIKTRLENRNK